MKKGLLVLLLISFLVLPVTVMGSSSRPADFTDERECEAAGFVWIDGVCRAAEAEDLRVAPRVSLLRALDIIVNILFTILMAAAVLLIMIGAFGFLTAGGNAEAVNAARDKILYAVIAVIVAFLARGIVMFLEGAFPVN